MSNRLFMDDWNDNSERRNWWHTDEHPTSSSDSNSGRTKFSLGELFSIDAPDKKTAALFGLASLAAAAGFIWWKSDRKKSEDDNSSINKINEDNNSSANRIKENSASTDNQIRLNKEKYKFQMDLVRLMHEQWKDKQEYKKIKTGLVLSEIATHPLLSDVDIKPVSRKLNDFGSEEVKQTQELYENLINENETTIIFSPTNVGKTFASIQIGAEISEKFPNAYTLYYNQEMNKSQIQSLLFGNEKRPKYAENMEIISNVCTEEELIKDMILNIEQYRKNIVIFIDNITDLHPSSRNEKATEFLKLLKRIRINAKRIYGVNITYIIICHTNKLKENSRLEINNLKGNGNLGNFADRVIAIGRVPNHNDKRYFKILKGRNGSVVSDVVMIFKIVDEKPRLMFINTANENDVLKGKYLEYKIENGLAQKEIDEKWYHEHKNGKGYGTIAKEHFKLPKVVSKYKDIIKNGVNRHKKKLEGCV